MKIALKVVRGLPEDQGRVFEFEHVTPEDITVGRGYSLPGEPNEPCPRLSVSDTDPELARLHFILLFRPPLCFARDLGSSSHTFVNDFGAGCQIVQTTRLGNEDQIMAGSTVLQVSIEEATGEDEDDVSSHDELDTVTQYCVLCGGRLARDGQDIGNRFLCEACDEAPTYADAPGEEQSPPHDVERPPPPTVTSLTDRPKDVPRPGVRDAVGPSRIFCSACGDEDLTLWANRDGRSDELRDVALYMCGKCAGKERKLDTEVGEYHLLRRLGIGGMGIVYKAWHKISARVVALKELRADHATQKRSLRMFEREVSVAEKLIHPRLIRYYTSSLEGRKPYFVTEFLVGGDLQHRIDSVDAIPMEEACTLMLGTLEGLAFAHERGFVHRDLKPANILLDGHGMPKLADMGLAKLHELAGLSGITAADDVGGTLNYMAPEQFTDFKYVKPSADLYAVGACLYYMLTRAHPYDFPLPQDGQFTPEDFQKILVMIRDQPPRPIRSRRADIPVVLAEVVDQALGHHPSTRHKNARELATELQRAVRALGRA